MAEPLGAAVDVSAAAAAFELTRGAASAFAVVPDAGSPIMRHFCPNCGSPLWSSSPADPDRVYAKARA